MVNKIPDASVLVEETIDIREALSATAFRYMKNIVVESDSQIVVNWINGQMNVLSEGILN